MRRVVSHRHWPRHADRKRSGGDLVVAARRQERRGPDHAVRHHRTSRRSSGCEVKGFDDVEVLRQARAQAPRPLPAVRRRRGDDGGRGRGARLEGSCRAGRALGQLHRRGPRRRAYDRGHVHGLQGEGAAPRVLAVLRHRHHHQRAAGHGVDPHRRDRPEHLARSARARPVRTRSARRSARSVTATPTA